VDRRNASCRCRSGRRFGRGRHERIVRIARVEERAVARIDGKDADVRVLEGRGSGDLRVEIGGERRSLFRRPRRSDCTGFRHARTQASVDGLRRSQRACNQQAREQHGEEAIGATPG